MLLIAFFFYCFVFFAPNLNNTRAWCYLFYYPFQFVFFLYQQIFFVFSWYYALITMYCCVAACISVYLWHSSTWASSSTQITSDASSFIPRPMGGWSIATEPSSLSLLRSAPNSNDCIASGSGGPDVHAAVPIFCVSIRRRGEGGALVDAGALSFPYRRHSVVISFFHVGLGRWREPTAWMHRWDG